MESMKEGVKRMQGPGRMLAAVLLICAVFTLSSCMDKTAEEVSLTPEELQDFQELLNSADNRNCLTCCYEEPEQISVSEIFTAGLIWGSRCLRRKSESSAGRKPLIR